jgi:ATP-dependent Clp protease ATP-binding subunit ClpC
VAQRSQHAQRVLHLAREEAERSGHCYLGPEHLVLGVLHDGDSGASRVLEAHGVNLAAARVELRRLADQGLVIGPELLLLGVVTDIQTPWPRCMNNRWTRQLHASVGLPKDYRGAAGPLLQAVGADLDQLDRALRAELGAGVP